jgi:hypothetical protein
VSAPQYTGTDDELDALVEEAWITGSPSGVLDLSQVFAWRDAAVKAALERAAQRFRDNPMWATATSWDDATRAAEWFAGLVGDILTNYPNGNDHG